MRITQVTAAALALDGVRETQCDGLRKWYRRNRLVARQLDANSIVIRSDFAARERLLDDHPRTFTVTPQFEKHMMVVADLRRGDADAIARALRAAWELQSR